MNVRMWLHPATRRNIERLKADGVAFVGPDDGPMACGEFGPGRMAEPIAIVEAIELRSPAGKGDSAESAPGPLLAVAWSSHPARPTRRSTRSGSSAIGRRGARDTQSRKLPLAPAQR